MENYLYAGARLRALENALIGRERMERLLLCETTDDCWRLLEEWGVRLVRRDGSDAPDREATLTARLSDSYAEVLSSTDGAAFARLRLLPYDCNNIKSAIKCQKRGLDPSRMLITLVGGIPTETVCAAIDRRAFELLPYPFADAAREATEQLSRTGDPREVDRILDAACYAGMLALARESGVPLALELVVKRIDLTNVMIAIRSIRMGGDAGRRTLAAFFLPGGRLSLSELSEWSAAGEDALLDRLGFTVLERFARSARESDRSLAALERCADDDLMETAREAKFAPFGAEIAVGYLTACEYEIKDLRILLAGKSVGLDADALRERMRSSYV